ncbi:MAG: hypothetical protein R3264_04945, partial [Anaerolineae bacterium]|nr:hypothetical protein [Anaerolineae bacterium]
ALTAMLPNVRPARVEIKLKSGDILTETIERPRGGFDNPFTQTELIEKFQRLARLALPDKSVEALLTLIPLLPNFDHLSKFSHALQG